ESALSVLEVVSRRLRHPRNSTPSPYTTLFRSSRSATAPPWPAPWWCRCRAAWGAGTPGSGAPGGCRRRSRRSGPPRSPRPAVRTGSGSGPRWWRCRRPARTARRRRRRGWWTCRSRWALRAGTCRSRRGRRGRSRRCRRRGRSPSAAGDGASRGLLLSARGRVGAFHDVVLGGGGGRAGDVGEEVVHHLERVLLAPHHGGALASLAALGRVLGDQQVRVRLAQLLLQVVGTGRVGDDGLEPDAAVLGRGGEDLPERAAQLDQAARHGRGDPAHLGRGAGRAQLDHQHGFAVVLLGEGEGQRRAGVPGGGADVAGEVLASVQVAGGKVVDAAEHPGGD